MYTDGEPKGEVKRFIGLPETVDGKRIVEELGFIAK